MRDAFQFKKCRVLSVYEMSSNDITLLKYFVLCCAVAKVVGQGTVVEVTVDFGDGLIYFLVLLFFSLSFCTPIVRWIYVNYLSLWVEKASKEVSKASKRFTERMSDTSRRVAQSIRVDTKK